MIVYVYINIYIYVFISIHVFQAKDVAATLRSGLIFSPPGLRSGHSDVLRRYFSLAFFFNRWFLFTTDLTQTSTEPKNQEAGKPATKQTPRRGGWKLTVPIIGI